MCGAGACEGQARAVSGAERRCGGGWLCACACVCCCTLFFAVPYAPIGGSRAGSSRVRLVRKRIFGLTAFWARRRLPNGSAAARDRLASQRGVDGGLDLLGRRRVAKARHRHAAAVKHAAPVKVAVDARRERRLGHAHHRVLRRAVHGRALQHQHALGALARKLLDLRRLARLLRAKRVARDGDGRKVLGRVPVGQALEQRVARRGVAARRRHVHHEHVHHEHHPVREALRPHLVAVNVAQRRQLGQRARARRRRARAGVAAAAAAAAAVRRHGDRRRAQRGGGGGGGEHGAPEQRLARRERGGFGGGRARAQRGAQQRQRRRKREQRAHCGASVCGRGGAGAEIAGAHWAASRARARFGARVAAARGARAQRWRRVRGGGGGGGGAAEAGGGGGPDAASC
ncbi:glutathione peroxidase [Gracilaria domingensis]|nr:glutathione peroxidase [Gracilaria domingensis]